MPFLICRIQKRLILCRQPDGSNVLKSVDELDPSELIKEVMEHRLQEILAVTRKFDEFLTDQMTTREKLAAIVAATFVVGPIPSDPDTAENAVNSKMQIEAPEWHWLLAVAQANGWEPQGTTYPSAIPQEEDWDGSYVIPAGQGVSYEDTANLRLALLAALDRGEVGEPQCHYPDKDPKDIISEFADFCGGGYSLTIW